MRVSFALLSAAAFLSCAPGPQVSPRTAFRNAIDSLPSEWKEEPAVILFDSVILSLVPAPSRHVVLRREVAWIHVNKRNPNVFETIERSDFEHLEDPVRLSVSAWYPDGKTWKSGPGAGHRERVGTEGQASSNRFLTSLDLPRYADGTLIRIEEERRLRRPEFQGPEFLREDFPCLRKRVFFSAPDSMAPHTGILNPENLPLDTLTSVGDGQRRFSLDARRLRKLDARTMPREPESWFAAFHLSLPPDGAKALGWKELGDHYLAGIKAAEAPTPELTALAASIPDGPPDSIAARVLETVRSRIRYHADPDKLHAFVPRTAAQVLSNGYGDCKEMSTLMAVLLRLKGLTAGMALVSPPGHTQAVAGFPSLGVFNHMIAWLSVPGKPLLYFDPTVRKGDPRQSHFPLMHRMTLVLAPGASRLARIEPDADFRNRIETRSSIIRESEKEWRLDGTIRLEGLCAISLFPHLESAQGDEQAPFLKEYLGAAFGLRPTRCKAEAVPGRSLIRIEYQAPYSSNYLDLDRGGLLVNLPGLYGGEARYTTLDLEGPRHFQRFEQSDSWSLPEGFADFSSQPIDHKLGKGAWARAGTSLKRDFSASDAELAPAQREAAAEFGKLKTRFSRGTLWRK